METQIVTSNASFEAKERRKYARMSVTCIAVESCGILADSVHKAAEVRTIGQEVVTFDDYSSSGEFDTTWEIVEF